MVELSVLLVLVTISNVKAAPSKKFGSAILAIESPEVICCLKGFRAFSPNEAVEITMVHRWKDFRDFMKANKSTSNRPLIILYHVDEDFLLSAAYVHRSLMPQSEEAIVWLPKPASQSSDISLMKYKYMLSEIVRGTFNGSTKGRLTGHVLPNSTKIAFISEFVSVVLAVFVFGSGVYLRYVRATKRIEISAQARNTSKIRKLSREDAFRKLGTWTGLPVSYSVGVVLLGVQEVCIMLMTVYYFHWISYLLKLAFIVAFVTSADMLFDDVANEGPNSIEVPYFGSLNRRRSIFRLVLVAIGILWFFTRRSRMIWILHNFMASLMCIALISDISLPSMAAICSFAVLLAIYDLFMVFVTPKFTADGVSVMESAVLGIDGEVMPMVMYTPKFPSLTMYPQCAALRTGFLGLGDIIIPGIIGSYCANFDSMRMRESRIKTSYLASVSYFFGLIMTYLFREWMDSAQPALIYIIPMMLLVLLPGAVMLNIWSDFWRGHMRDVRKDVKKN